MAYDNETDSKSSGPFIDRFSGERRATYSPMLGGLEGCSAQIGVESHHHCAFGSATVAAGITSLDYVYRKSARKVHAQGARPRRLRQKLEAARAPTLAMAGQRTSTDSAGVSARLRLVEFGGGPRSWIHHRFPYTARRIRHVERVLNLPAARTPRPCPRKHGRRISPLTYAYVIFSNLDLFRDADVAPPVPHPTPLTSSACVAALRLSRGSRRSPFLAFSAAASS
mmetsp:Transcript_27593/g.50949  ORF Transcript_27593/g.50949 Transcript_27593/m.50949 type:complete len:225 (-) Transcript_27593:825-1499(-)